MRYDIDIYIYTYRIYNVYNRYNVCNAYIIRSNIYLSTIDNKIITPYQLIRAYMLGMFPMSEGRKNKKFFFRNRKHPLFFRFLSIQKNLSS